MKYATINYNEINSSLRFDGSYHLSEGVLYSSKIQKMKFDFLGNLASEIFTAGRTKRIYTSKEKGYPYLSNSDVSKNNPFDNCNFSSKKHGFDEKSVLKEGMIVTGRVGAIGQTAFINSEYEELKAMGSDNIIRIIAKDKNISGYIYAYLTSKYGNTFFHKLASGGVQPYISEEMIKDIPIPLIPETKQKEIHNLILEASALKVEANKLLKETIELFESQLNESNVKLGFQFGSISSTEIFSKQKRFDSQYQILWKSIKNEYKSIEYQKLVELAKNIFVGGRGKRNYVENGIPFLSSSDMMLFNPVRNSKKVSFNTPGLKSMRVDKFDILISRSGTVGNTIIVGDSLKNVLVSEHALRLKINSEAISPCYVFAFLNTNIGKRAMEASAFGSVIITLNEELIGDIDIPILDKLIQNTISTNVENYIDSIDCATIKENQAIDLIEKEIDTWQ